ncbi:sec-independent protein translocase protein TatC [Caldalkalibacillus uzonensis]|uniref:Sec-independent protein translocase protein TatC n=1 Tax=Caldalkalibacillus uzonensis TaxID=353224 RepID=A0ABU0CVJ5_9BACI|nr:twin-arginine translocase subunit TatC [Caldalkalibacillus uzonensis]MDQ0340433.1 sec-independent protein translocase protein TatC [Caldalkalibacillus uzonensis]
MEQEQRSIPKHIKRTNIKHKQSDDMSVMEHIGELRKRVIYVLILFLVSMVLGFFLADNVVQYLQKQPVAAQIPWVVIGLTDAFKVFFLFSIVVGLVITFPFALYQIWAFVSPGLTEKERKITLAYIPGAAVLFVAGLAFGYYWLFPFVIQFMTGIASRLGAEEMYGMIHYFQFMFTLVVPFGFIFQMPLLVLFLTRLGVVSPLLLKRMRKYAYFALFVIAALITPPELLSHLLVTVPLIILYEISVWLSQLTYRRMAAKRINQE